MNSITKIGRLSNLLVGRRGFKVSTNLRYSTPTTQAQKAAALQNYDPENYNIPLRPVTMDDLMEPYGSWKLAYERERREANFTLLKGIACFTVTMIIFFNSGVTEGLIMPNLDNVMEETEPWNFDKEGRITV